MTQSKHTPAPWLRDGRTVYALTPSDMWDDGKRVLQNKFTCLIQGLNKIISDEELEANVRLILAAPELLEALEACEEDLKSAGHQEWRAYKAAITAIAKARGE